MLTLNKITKSFPGTLALDNVSLSFEPGKVHALIGKNGAGKSTLIKILSGAHKPDSGEIAIDKTNVQFDSPRDAFERGVATVYQELSLIPELSVAENILFGRLPQKKRFGLSIIHWEKVFEKAGKLLQDLNITIDLKKKVSEFDVAQQQMIEIAKAMSFQPKILLLDEPTSALAHHEVQSLFTLIRKLAAKGITIIYISHRLQELNDIADDVTVLRDGKIAGLVTIGKATPAKLTSLMFGEDIKKSKPIDYVRQDQVVLKVSGLNVEDKLFDVNFEVYKGEILGIAGMLGSGRTELLRAIFGADTFDSGSIEVNGQLIAENPSPALMKNYGIGLTPENRKDEGLVQILSVRKNLCMASLDKISTKGLLDKKRERETVNNSIKNLHMQVTSGEQKVNTLSGGNQQKVVIGNWINTEPQILLFDEPSRGIDVHAKQQIFSLMKELSQDGISSIFVSTELEELLEVCNRILILRKGRIVEEISSNDLSLDALFEMCMGA